MTGEARNKAARQRPAKAPISSHGAFPAIVALWFAALLGLGSLILPVALFESLSLAANLPAISPAAEPPLGVTARIAIALLAALIGGLLGLLIARRIAALQAVEAPRERDPLAPLLRSGDSHPDAPVKRPIFAHAELGERRLDDPLDLDGEVAGRPLANRRRSLSLTDDGGRSEYLGDAPMPGETAAAQPHFSLREESEQPDSAGRELAPRDLTGEGIVEQVEITVDDGNTLDLGVYAEPELASEPNFANAETAYDAEAKPETSVSAAAETPFDRMSLAELVDRFARSLQGRDRPDPAGDATFLRTALHGNASSRDNLPVPGEDHAGDIHDQPDAADEAAPSRGRQEEGSLSQPPVDWEATGFGATKADYIPAALRPLAFAEESAEDESEDEDFRIDFSGSHRLFGPPGTESVAIPAAFADPVALAIAESEDEEEDCDEDFDGFSSLLAMKRPLDTGRETVRIDDEPEMDGDASVEPVVTFPGHAARPFAAKTEPAAQPEGTGEVARPFDAPDNLRSLPGARPAPSTAPPPRRRDPAASEKALRDALEKLQRMSGAA